MKLQSERYPDVFRERWKTPMGDITYHYIHLVCLLQTVTRTHFFFEVFDSKKIYVMNIPRHHPYRLIEEGLADACICKYWLPKGPYKPLKRRKGRPKKRSSTWKLWGTSFIKELDEGHELSGFAKERDKTICEYLIMTGNEWIEIVNCEPEWEIYQNIKLKKLIERFVKSGDL